MIHNESPDKAREVGFEIPPVPLTLEGWSVLHQMFRIRWPEWHASGATEKKAAIDEAVNVFRAMESGKHGRSGFCSLLGHKGDLMLIHFRPTVDELNEAELTLSGLELWPFLEATTSYLSIVELGLYSMTAQL